MKHFKGIINPNRDSERFFYEHPIVDKKLVNLLNRSVKACKEWSDIKGENESEDSKEYSNYMNFLLSVAKHYTR